MTKHRTRRERGTVAVVVALSATMIFALCALAVDLGSAFARKRDIQTQADLATLAAAAQLPYSASTKSAIELAATKYAISNEVAGQDATTWNFADADRTNGYIEYVGANKLRLFAPKSQVDFWLAPVAGLPNGMDVSALAAAEILSPGRALPFYVSTTCGWGEQTILDQTAGPSLPPGYSPTLVPTSTATANSSIASIDPMGADLNETPPVQIEVTAEGTGPNPLNGVNGVGFTTEDGDHDVVDVSPSGRSVLVTVPSTTVLATEAVWWVRLREGNASNRKWSASSNAKPFIVGDPDSEVPAAECDSKTSGNFGSLDLSRDDVAQPSRYLVENMAQGVQHDFDKYPSTPVVPCAGQAVAVTDAGTPVEGRRLNCLETDTGSDLAQKATDAFITGTPFPSPGRLDQPTASGCSPEEGDEKRRLEEISSETEINDDVLSCFLPPDVTVGDVTGQNIAAEHKFKISPDIFLSPRFFWIPVLTADPSSGGSSSYPIVDFRAVFITEQPDSATVDEPAAEPGNGIIMSGNGKQIEKIRVRALNPLALPESTVGLGDDNTVDYLGTGTKIIRLVE